MICEISLLKSVYEYTYDIAPIVPKHVRIIENYLETAKRSENNLVHTLSVLMNNSDLSCNENLYANIIKIDMAVSAIDVSFFYLVNLLNYILRKNDDRREVVLFQFNTEESIEPLLEEVINIMSLLNNKISVSKRSYVLVQDSRDVINEFKKHGHYLLNLSHSQNKHHIQDVLLYIRYVRKVIVLIDEQLILQMLKYLPLYKM